jgi:Methyltransferase domain
MRTEFDEVVYDRRWHPFYGWHDDHAQHDRTLAYAPAMQQSRQEWHDFVALLHVTGCRGRGLQIGLGAPGASHAAWCKMFASAWTIEIDGAKIDEYERRIGNRVGIIHGDSHDMQTVARVAGLANPMFDCVLIDANHTLDGVRLDFERYSRFVRHGGIIAMHDALKRPTYENEIQVWRFIDELREKSHDVRMIGEQLGIAWMVRHG